MIRATHELSSTEVRAFYTVFDRLAHICMYDPNGPEARHLHELLDGLLSGTVEPEEAVEGIKKVPLSKFTCN